MLAVVDWTNVLVALIAGLPAILAAVAAMLVRREVKTTNGIRLGSQVEEVHKLVTDAAPIVQQIVTGDVEPPHGQAPPTPPLDVGEPPPPPGG